jgi:hypothetical protein
MAATQPTAQHRVYIVRRMRIISVMAGIVVTEKRTWAEVKIAHTLRRFTLGTTAFYTPEAAIARLKSELLKMADTSLPPWHVAGQIAERARYQLEHLPTAESLKVVEVDKKGR